MPGACCLSWLDISLSLIFGSKIFVCFKIVVHFWCVTCSQPCATSIEAAKEVFPVDHQILGDSCKIEAIYSPPHKHLPRVRVFHCAAGCKAGLVKQARPHDERLQAKTSLLRSHPKWISSLLPKQVSICPCCTQLHLVSHAFLCRW